MFWFTCTVLLIVLFLLLLFSVSLMSSDQLYPEGVLVGVLFSFGFNFSMFRNDLSLIYDILYTTHILLLYNLLVLFI